MAVYLVYDIEVTDPETYREYIKLATAAIDKYGGKYVVRGGSYQVLEGDWQPKRLVITEWEDEEHMRRWYDSPEYSAARAIRQKSSISNGIMVQGIS
jgi:uncharacterized protein (DUF1330 family)